MLFLLFTYMAMLKKTSPSLFNPSFFDTRQAANLGCSIRTVKPVLQFPAGLVQPGFQVGTRGNAVDAPRWPRDLLAETVKDVQLSKL